MPNRSGRFDKLVLKNVRCFQDATIPLDDHVTIIIGENGSGKSTIIEALASLSQNEERNVFKEFPLRSHAKRGEIALYQGRRSPAGYWRAGGPASGRRDLPDKQYFFAYGRYRRVFIDEVPASSESRTPAELLDELARHAHDRRTATINEPDNHLLRDISGYLVALDFGRKSDRRLQLVWDKLNLALPQIDPRLGNLQIMEDPTGTSLHLVRHGVPMELRQLSDGYQSLLVVIFDLALRYPYIFGQDNPLEGNALVAIDEVDLHLHPRWQRVVVTQLTSLFPNTQFVITTHSPVVAQGSIDDKRTIVVLQDEAGAVVPRRLSKALLGRLRGAEVSSVLLERHLFGLESRYSVEFSQIENKVDDLQRRISSNKASDGDYSDLSAALTQLEELVAREDERRADSSTVAQMAKLQASFVKDLVKELKKARS